MPYVAQVTLRVRYAETDAMRIVHHSKYLVYFEEGRSNYARERGYPYSLIEQSGYFLAVTGINIRYIKAAVYEQEITISTWIAEMKSRGLTFAYEIRDTASNDLLVEGTSKHICITQDGTVARIPEKWREWADD